MNCLINERCSILSHLAYGVMRKILKVIFKTILHRKKKVAFDQRNGRLLFVMLPAFPADNSMLTIRIYMR